VSGAGALASPRHTTRIPLAALFAAACALFSIVTLFTWDAFRHASLFGLIAFYERHDMHVYFLSSGWVEGQGTLYREVASEYLLLPNLLFGAVRVLSRLVPVLSDPFDRFAWTWVSLTLPLYLFVLLRLIRRYPRAAPLLWLTPSALHFSLYRFDVYTVIVLLFAMEAIHQRRLRRGALLLGVVTALKGYALFLLPAYTLYAWYLAKPRIVLDVLVLQLAPFVLANLAVVLFAGSDGMLFPFRFQALRGLNGESGFDAISYVTGPWIRDLVARAGWLPAALQGTCALIAAAFRPRTFDDLLRAFLFATVGFVSFSVFYSPQFVMWLVPFTAWWTMPRASWVVIALSWITYVYFPIMFFRREHHPGLFRGLIVVVAALRAALLALAAFPSRRAPAVTPVAAPA
jgi:hypothetical protein